ncbi:MAG: DUF2785 domain-containing protein [Defluviitaleaceae bacterium]|nr:DUF2785 domain-containing protein [Defluviitaleaceae bacterium]
MKTFEELKQCLIQIKNNDYSVSNGVDVDITIAGMLKFIGHTDGEFRDGLAYSTFNSWTDNGTISTTQMRHILTTCLGEQHLFFGIGEKDTDSVFTRSFSSLVIALAFCLHDKKPFLTIADVKGIKETLLRYMGKEKDCRGYVNGKGWAHAADALGNTAGCEIDGKFCFDGKELLEILDAVKTLILCRNCVYTAEEDERLIWAVNAVCANNILTNEDLIAWVDSFNPNDKEWWNGAIPGDYYLHVNRKNFLRSLYFNFLAPSDELEIVDPKAIAEHLLVCLLD